MPNTRPLSEVQDVEVNYYVLVPFTTLEGALLGAGHIAPGLDCHIVSAAAVDQKTIDYTNGEFSHA